MAKKKITKRKKKLLVPCATSTVLVEPGLRPTDLRTAHGEFTRVDLTPKPKPQNVADAWDAMKEAGELPHGMRYKHGNPYRAAQDREELLAALPIHQTTPSELAKEMVFDSTRQAAPDTHQSPEPSIPALAPL